jgi:pimeloyl-ACP methyl ester carboxylesterase
MRRLLDHLEIEQVIVVGHMSGGMAAIRLAILLPERVGALALVSCVPAWTEANLAYLPARIRLFALTVLRAPKVLPLIARAGAAYADAGYEDQLIRMFHGDIPADMLALRRPEVRQIVIDGIRHGISQGINGFCHECPIILKDWTAPARLVRQPLHLIHGALDVSCRPDDARRLVDALPNADLTSLEGVGLQLL